MKIAASIFGITMLVTACIAHEDSTPTESTAESEIGLDESLDQEGKGKACTSDADCTTRRCVDRVCVQCRTSADCGFMGTCSSSHECVP